MLKFKLEKLNMTDKGSATLLKIGCLSILRPDGWVLQDCPFTANARCGEWCPHLGEVEKGYYTDNNDKLDLCHGKVIRGEFVSKEGE